VLGSLPDFTRGSASGINSNGLVVGTLWYNGRVQEATVWHGTTPTLLPELKPGSGSIAAGEALAAYSSGLIVGYSRNSDGYTVAAAWANGVVTNLGTLPNGSASYTTAVNTPGTIVGVATTKDGFRVAAIWPSASSKAQDLNSLISAAAAKEYVLTAATGINGSCSIVANGYAKKTGATVSVAFLLTPTDSSGCANGF
jgi:probable HAF family extracellular repeat protein